MSSEKSGKSTIEARLDRLGLNLPEPLKISTGVRLPFGIPVEIEAEVEIVV